MAENPSDQSQPKTHEPTPRRLQQAREQGEVVQSRDLHTFALYVMVAIVLLAAIGPLIQGMGQAILGPLWHADHAPAWADYPDMAAVVRHVFGSIGPWWLALLAILAVGPLISVLGQQALVVAGKNVQPKLSRISLIQNAKQKYGPKGLVEFLKSLVKLSAVVAITAAVLTPFIAQAPSYTGAAPTFLGGILHRELVALALGVTALYAGIGAIDYLWQRHMHLQKHRIDPQGDGGRAKRDRGQPPGQRQAARTRTGGCFQPHAVRHPHRMCAGGQPGTLRGRAQMAAGPAGRAGLRGQGRGPHGAGAPPGGRRRTRCRCSATRRSLRLLHASMEVGDEVEEEHYKAVAVAIRFALKLDRQRRAERPKRRMRTGQDPAAGAADDR